MDFAAEQSAIERRRRIAEMLMQQGAEPMQTNQVAGGYVVPVSPLGAVAKVAQQLAGAYMGKKSDERAAELQKQQSAALMDVDFSAPDAARKLAGMGLTKEALQLAMQRGRERSADPYFTPVETSAGLFKFNARTGEYEPMMEGEKRLMRSTSDPSQQAQITAAKEGQKGVEVMDPEGRQFRTTQAKANPEAFTNLIPNLIPNLIRTESGGDPNAVSPKGARGVTQIMPATAQDPGFGVEPMRDNSVDEQIRFGSDYVRALVKYFNGDVQKALSAYNAGPGTVEQKGITNQGYVDKVLNQEPIKGPSLREKEAVQIEGAAAKKAAEMQAANLVEAQRDLPRVADDTLQSLNLIDEVLQSPDLDRVTGVMGKIPNLPGSKASDLQATIDAIKSKNYMAGFDQLRGAGAISEAEGRAAQAAYANLDQNVSAEKFRETLLTLKSIKDRALQRMAEKAGAQQPAQPAINRRRGGVTGSWSDPESNGGWSIQRVE
jgi:hypothetical protein